MENSKGAKQEFTSMKDKTMRNNPTELGEKRRQVPQGMYEHVKLMEFGGGWVGVPVLFSLSVPVLSISSDIPVSSLGPHI